MNVKIIKLILIICLAAGLNARSGSKDKFLYSPEKDYLFILNVKQKTIEVFKVINREEKLELRLLARIKDNYNMYNAVLARDFQDLTKLLKLIDC